MELCGGSIAYLVSQLLLLLFVSARSNALPLCHIAVKPSCASSMPLQ
jgi:hypothetical protein